MIDLLAAIVAKVRAKAKLSEYADLLDELMLAVDGVAGLSEEVKSEHLGGLISYAGKIIAEAIAKPKVVQP